MIDMAKLRNLEIDDTRVDKEMCKQASNFLYVGERSVNASVEYDTYKAKHDQLIATLDEKIRSAKAAAKEKTTETAMTKEIERHPDFLKSKLHLIKLKGVKDALMVLKESWLQRQWLLLELSKKQRDEMRSLMTDAVKAAA